MQGLPAGRTGASRRACELLDRLDRGDRVRDIRNHHRPRPGATVFERSGGLLNHLELLRIVFGRIFPEQAVIRSTHVLVGAVVWKLKNREWIHALFF